MKIWRLIAVMLFAVSLASGQGNTCQPGYSCYGSVSAAGTAAVNYVLLPLFQDTATVVIQLGGTFTATVQFEGSADGGQTWVAVNATPPNSTTSVTSATATGVWRSVASGFTHIRARCSAYTSGTVTVQINASKGSAAGTLGSSGGTVTAVTGVAPIASTGGATPAISLQNSTPANVTSALGTDTAILTASGSATTNGDVIAGDAQGGIADNSALNFATISSTITAAEPLNMNSSPMEFTWSNNAAATVLHKLVQFTGAPSQVTIAATSSTTAFGVCNANCGASGSAQIVAIGQAQCVFDNGTTAGDYVGVSTSIAGDCTDLGATYPASGEVIGIVRTTNAGAGTYAADFNPPDLTLPGSQGGGKVKGTLGYVGVFLGSNQIGTSSTSANQQLFWDNTNFRLGIGTVAPADQLDIESTSGAVQSTMQSTAAASIVSLYMEGKGATAATSPEVNILNTGAGANISSVIFGSSSVGANQAWFQYDPQHNQTKIFTFNMSNSFGGADQAMEFNDHRVAITGGLGTIGGNSVANVPLTVSCCIAHQVAGVVVQGSEATANDAISATIQNTQGTDNGSALNIGGNAVAHQARLVYDVGNTGADNFSIMDTGNGSATSRPLIFFAAQKLYLGNAGSGTIPSGGGQINFMNSNATTDLSETGGILQSPNTSGTNVAATDFVLAAGTGTGNAAVSHIKLQSPALGLTSGTGAETQVTRWVSHTKAGSTTSATATNMFNINSATNTAWGLEVLVHVDLISSTPNVCGTTERFSLTGTNNNGAFGTVNIVAGTTSTLCSTGTLTLAVTATAANPSVISVTPTWATITSITSDTITIQVENVSQQDITLL